VHAFRAYCTACNRVTVCEREHHEGRAAVRCLRCKGLRQLGSPIPIPAAVQRRAEAAQQDRSGRILARMLRRLRGSAA
jgi:hypothetical protein